MSFELVDVQLSALGITPGEKNEGPSPQELLNVLDKYQVKGALVRCEPYKLEVNTVHCNQKLFDFCSGSVERLMPCPIISPATALDLPTENQQVDSFIKNNSKMVRIRPEMEGWIIAEWLSDKLFRSLEERRLPLLALQSNAPVEKYAEIAEKYSNLPIVLAGVGYRSQHVLLPLMQRFENVYLSIGNNFTVHWGIEQFCSIIGAKRLLFGSGYPKSEYACAISQLAYADISMEEKQMIGSLNFQRLAGGIKE